MNFSDGGINRVLRILLLFYYAISIQSQEEETKCLKMVKSKKPPEAEWYSPWTYKCLDDICHRTLFTVKDDFQTSLEVCWLNCGKYGALWPYPTAKTKLGSSTISFQNSNLAFKVSSSGESNEILNDGINIFKERFKQMEIDGISSLENVMLQKSGAENLVNVHLHIKQKEMTSIDLNTDESYYLRIKSSGSENGLGDEVTVEIRAETYFGARHGLETLYQLIVFDIYKNCLQIVSVVEIEDSPSYPYRGLLIDTARNFIPISSLKRMVDGMSYNKLNVLHLHITDSNSFPFYSKRVPQMTNYGAYGPSKIYYPDELKSFIGYARRRGVKVIVELDFPAHAGNGWQWGPLEGLGEMALCVNKEPWRTYCGQPPCGQLNPANPNVLKILGFIFQDMLEIFDSDMFHMGGDEVFLKCWFDEPEIRKMAKQGNYSDYLDIWGMFQQQAFNKLKESNNYKAVNPILWTSGLTGSDVGRKYLNNSEYIIQVWEDGRSQHVKTLIQEKYRLIFSNVDALYLDQGFGTWLGTDHNWKYQLWQKIYDNSLKKLTIGAAPGQILGGEATLWSEKVNEYNMDMKLWPRSAALAENLWSNPDSRDNFVTARLIHQNNRMIQLGISADQLQPESCHRIKGYCPESDKYKRV